jgi:hypothetical protein
MNAGKKLLKALEGVSTESNEFYDAVSRYFWKRTRPNINYGFFLIFLGVIVTALALVHDENMPSSPWIIGISIVAALLGGIMIRSVMQVAVILKHGREDRHPLRRLHRLRIIAKVYRGDVISTFVLGLPIAKESAAGPEPMADYEHL